MTYDTPLSPRPLPCVPDPDRQVVTAGILRARGISAATARERCRGHGPWQTPLPGVFLLHRESPTERERLAAVLLYAGGTGARSAAAPAVGGAQDPGGPEPGRVPSQSKRPVRPVITGEAALALYGFTAVPALADQEQIDVLVPRNRRPRSTGWARVVRTHTMPAPQLVDGVPVAPVARALADAVARTTEPTTVHRLLTETIRDGHCEAPRIVRELSRARLLSRPQVVDAVDTLLAEGRALAEGRLYALVRAAGLPEPCWNVELRRPGGPRLGALDAYWPDEGVGVEIDTRASGRAGSGALWPPYARQRETLSRLGITVISVRPERLREEPERVGAAVRAALVTAEERDPASYVHVEPR